MELRKNSGRQSHIVRNLEKEILRLKKYRSSVIEFCKPTQLEVDRIDDEISANEIKLANHLKAKCKKCKVKLSIF